MSTRTRDDNGQVLIRAARPGDEADVARMHVRSWQSAYAGLLPAEFLAGLDPARRAQSYNFSIERSDPFSTMVVEEGGRVLGFATAGPSRGRDTAGAGELFGLYVDPDHWRRGLGKLLMADSYAQFVRLGFTEAVLWVLEGNWRAEAFYRAEGWTRDGGEQDDDIGPGWRAASTAPCEIPVLHEVRYRRLL